jgi:predicted HAD superfamily Cof-like phosphohydrolase
MDDDASLNLWQFRNDLVYEEAMEFHDAFKGPDPAHILKEMADLLYVLYGTAVSYGWDLDEAFKRVHRSNMSKFPMTKNKDGKVVKGPNYIPPQLQDLVE